MPAISVTGTDDWLGEWTFALPQGSMTDEPIFWADLLAKGGHTEVGAIIEQSLIGESYISNFRKACVTQGIRVVAEEWIAQTAQEVGDAVRKLYEAKPKPSCTADSGSGWFRSTRLSRRSVGTHPASWVRRSRTPGSTT